MEKWENGKTWRLKKTLFKVVLLGGKNGKCYVFTFPSPLMDFSISSLLPRFVIRDKKVTNNSTVTRQTTTNVSDFNRFPIYVPLRSQSSSLSLSAQRAQHKKRDTNDINVIGTGNVHFVYVSSRDMSLRFRPNRLNFLLVLWWPRFLCSNVLFNALPSNKTPLRLRSSWLFLAII